MPIRKIKTKFFTFSQNGLKKKIHTNPYLGINKIIIIESIDFEMAKYKLDQMLGYDSQGEHSYKYTYGAYYQENNNGRDNLSNVKDLLEYQEKPYEEVFSISIHYLNGKIININKTRREYKKYKNTIIEIIKSSSINNSLLK